MATNNKLDILINSNRNGALKNDIVSYTIDITNIGNFDLTNVVINVTLPSSIQFYNNLSLNGASISDLLSAINAGNLAINSSLEITFNVKVTSVTGGQAIVKALVSYSYVDDSNLSLNAVDKSEDNILIIYKPDILITQSANKELIKIGDILIYTIMISNSGDIDINNLVVKDEFPSQLAISLIKVDGVISVGNITTGLTIGNILRGEDKKFELYIDVLGLLNGTDTFINNIETDFEVTSDPNFPSSNISKNITDINKIIIVKEFASVNKKIHMVYESIGNNVEYTLIVTNELKSTFKNSTLYNVILSDILAPELKFIPGSLKVDNVNYFDANILYGINLGDLNARESKTVTFLAKILSQNLSPINNFATLEYKFIINYYLPMQIDVIYSNSVGVVSQVTDISIIKSADKTEASLNDEIVYTITINNTSQVDIIKAVFKDVLPNSVALIDGSFKIDNVVVNSVKLEDGVVIGSIDSGNQKIINYTVSINSADSSGKIENIGVVDYIYKFPDDITESKNKNSNKTIINLI